MSQKPNILFFHVDNLGLGELGCYGGGILRGAKTERIDQFASEGFKLTHYVVEAQCTPTRSALLTGRYSIRSGNHTLALPGEEGGLVAWEKTLGDVLSEAGYATSCLGKWHVGGEDGRWPTDHGFDEWYGPEKTWEESLWPEDPWYDPEYAPLSLMMEGTKEIGSHKLADQQLTIDLRRDVDLEFQKRAFDFIQKSVDGEKPFFLYYNHSMLHLPLVPRAEFKGKSGNGDAADCLLELDHDFGEHLDFLDELGIAENTIVVFAGDNGPEDHMLWRGASGFFDGSYFSSSEGGIRTPCLVRWPGKVPEKQESNEMVHVTDMFTTLLKWAGCEAPQDRVIDGVDQTPFFLGQQEKSNREGCLLWVSGQMHGIKWRDFKIMYVKQRYFFDPVEQGGLGYLINLITDPKEREPVNHQYLHSWVAEPAFKILKEFQMSVAQEPLIPTGAPLDFVPKAEQ